MKLIHGILGCAVAIGLATCSTSSVQAAGTVFENTVFTPLSMMFQVRYNDNKGRVRELVVTSKEVLKLLGYPSSDQLATDYDGEGDSADVFVINKSEIVDDLTDDGIMTIDFNPLVTVKNKNSKDDSFSDSEKGILDISFDFVQDIQNSAVAQGNEQPPSGTETAFEVNGVYVFSETGGAVKNGLQKITTKLTATNIQGDGSITDSSPDVKSNITTTDLFGDFLILHGTANGTGSGTVEIE